MHTKLWKLPKNVAACLVATSPPRRYQDDDLERLHALFEEVGEEAQPAEGQDISAAHWLQQKGATPNMVAAAEACYANDFGCSLRQLDLSEMITENKLWDSGASGG